MIKKYHFTLARVAIIKKLQTINAGEGVEKRESSCTVGGNVNWYSHCGQQYGDSLTKHRTKSYDPAIPLLGIHPEKTVTQKDICTPVLKHYLLIQSQDMKTIQMSTHRWMNKEDVVHICHEILAIKRSEIESVVVMQMNLETVIRSEASQNMESRKMVLMNVFAGPERGADIEIGLVDTEEEWMGDELKQ